MKKITNQDIIKMLCNGDLANYETIKMLRRITNPRFLIEIAKKPNEEFNKD